MLEFWIVLSELPKGGYGSTGYRLDVRVCAGLVSSGFKLGVSWGSGSPLLSGVVHYPLTRARACARAREKIVGRVAIVYQFLLHTQISILTKQLHDDDSRFQRQRRIGKRIYQ